MGAEPCLGQDRLQADAAGEDQADAASMGLAVLAEPAHELVRACRRSGSDAVVIPLEQPVDEDRQLVDGEHDRPVASGRGPRRPRPPSAASSRRRSPPGA